MTYISWSSEFSLKCNFMVCIKLVTVPWADTVSDLILIVGQRDLHNGSII